MTKFFFSIFLFWFLFLSLFGNSVFAQSPGSVIPVLPGIDCGNSVGSSSAQKKCCFTQPFAATSAGWISKLKDVPLLGGLIGTITSLVSPFEESALQLQRKTNTINCAIGYPSDINDPNCTCLLADKISPTPIESLKKLCLDYFAGSKESGQCSACAGQGGVWTSLGICAYGDFGKFIQETVFKWGVGLAGIFALLCIIYSSILLQTSRNNPEKIKKSQELLTSCIMGLVLIIFSVFILKLIGVDILRIPGFSK